MSAAAVSLIPFAGLGSEIDTIAPLAFSAAFAIAVRPTIVPTTLAFETAER